MVGGKGVDANMRRREEGKCFASPAVELPETLGYQRSTSLCSEKWVFGASI